MSNSANVLEFTLQSDPNAYLCATIANVDSSFTDDTQSYSPDPRTELDSHANMVLLGKHAFIFDGASGRTCNVQPFDPSLGAKRDIPIRDGALAYDCPHTHKTYILIVRNALSVPSL